MGAAVERRRRRRGLYKETVKGGGRAWPELGLAVTGRLRDEDKRRGGDTDVDGWDSDSETGEARLTWRESTKSGRQVRALPPLRALASGSVAAGYLAWRAWVGCAQCGRRVSLGERFSTRREPGRCRSESESESEMVVVVVVGDEDGQRQRQR